MQPTLINDWWLSTDTHLGTSDTSGITAEQKHNADKIYLYFRVLGWSVNAISGIVGNMNRESFLSPAYIQSTNRYRLPNSAANLSDVPNNVMINFYDGYYGLQNGGFGVGLVQWDGDTNTPPAGQKLVSFAERYGLNWYDGDTQVFRIKREKEENLQWVVKTIDGITWTWDNFIISTASASDLANVWMRCYEISDYTHEAERRANATWWYNYFTTSPPTNFKAWMVTLFDRRKKVLKNVKR